MRFQNLLFMFIMLLSQQLNAQISIDWVPREDLNILLPRSVRIYEGNGWLSDSARVRIVYASVNLNDRHITLQAIGSNDFRQTTLEACREHDGILAINGGYFSSTASVSLLVANGEIIAPGPNKNVLRGAFGLVNGKPEIVWPYVADSKLVKYPAPINPTDDKDLKSKPWNPTQAVGGGPVLIKDGNINVTSAEEGFGGSHLLRHPRTAIGYKNDSTLLMMVVDGRQATSAGVTLPELAALMLKIGCYEAVNLDGGGSSAMVSANEVVNIPVDVPAGNRNSLRKNASALIVGYSKPGIDKPLSIIDTDSRQYSEQGVWRNTNHTNFYGITNARTAKANAFNKATYSFDSLHNGNYQLAAWWTVQTGNTSAANYILHRENITDTIRASQNDLSSSGKWNVLGDFNLQAGDYLEIIGNNGETQLIVDAVRLVANELYPSLPKRGDLRIAVISDLNSGLGSATYEWQVDSIVARLPRIWRPDIVVCGGDMVAGMGISDTLVLKKMWEAFAEHISRPLKQNNIPFAFTLGNHDGTISHKEERAYAQQYWHNHQNDLGINFIDKMHFPAYYSFSNGEAFFISIDASSPSISNENIRWLENQLRSAEAKHAKFRFVIGHIPLYSVAQERDSKGNVIEGHAELQGLLEKYNVHSYLSGHQHAYYPGKNGSLQLLNAGATGSGPRRWLDRDDTPINTLTLMDVFFDQDTVVYTSFDIKHQKSDEMTKLDYHALSSSIQGVNGTIIRNDLPYVNSGSGTLYAKNISANNLLTSFGEVNLDLSNNQLSIVGNVITTKPVDRNKTVVSLMAGKHTERGELLFPLSYKKTGSHSLSLKGTYRAPDDVRERLATGAFFVTVEQESVANPLRAQIYPNTNRPPSRSRIISHAERNSYGIRNTEALYPISFSTAADEDGDKVDYTYVLATDSTFNHVVMQRNTGRQPRLKLQEKDWFQLLDQAETNSIQEFYHRVITSDGKHFIAGPVSKLTLTKSDEEPDDYIEVEPPQYAFEKIADAAGAGSGAQWDKNGNLWLADYNGNLNIKSIDGKDAPFSPLKSVLIKGVTHPLRPVNGIGIDNDGNILIGSNRYLLKIDAETGAGIALWEAPIGKRAITTPRVNKMGEIYAMSLFPDDPNYVLRQSDSDPSSFELLRTIELKDRILARTFDMDKDGHTLFFPDPGSPLIQVYKSKDAITYHREENINSIAAGSNAIRIIDSKLFVAVRSSGITPTTLHYRDNIQRIMWTLQLPELNQAEPRGIAVSKDGETIVICNWDKGGGFYKYTLRKN